MSSVQTISLFKNTTTVLWLFVRDYPGDPVPEEHSPIHIYHDHQSSFISFLHLLRSTASSLFNLRADSLFAQPLSKSSLVWHPPLRTPYISSPNSFSNMCLYQRNIFCCSTEIMSSNPSLSFSCSFLNVLICQVKVLRPT